MIVRIASYFCLKLKGEERKAKNKNVETILQIHAQNGSAVDTWINSKKFPC